MNFRTFFTLLFLISITFCISSTFFPDILKQLMLALDSTMPIKFVGMASLITAVFSYIGMLFAYYFASKREKKRLEKLQKDRETIDSIHAELEELRG